MNMTLKRKLVATTGALLTAVTMVLGANAYTTYNSGEKYHDLTNSTYVVNGTYGKMGGEPEKTTLLPTSKGDSMGYADNYKTVKYYSYKKVSGKFVLVFSRIENGTSRILSTSEVPIVSNIVLRSHNAYLSSGSSSSSKVVEYYHVNVNKLD